MTKKITILLVFLTIYSSIFTQDDYANIEVLDSKKTGATHVNTFKTKNTYLSFYRTKSNRPQLILNIIDENFKLKEAKEINLSETNYPIEIKEVEGGAMITYIERAKNKFFLKVAKYNFETLSIEDEKITIQELTASQFANIPGLTKTRSTSSSYNVQLIVSENKKLFSVYILSEKYYKRSESIVYYQVYNANLTNSFKNEILYQDIEKEKYQIIHKLKLHNDGTIQGIKYNYKSKTIKLITFEKDGVKLSKNILTEDINYKFNLENDFLNQKLDDENSVWASITNTNKKWGLVLFTGSKENKNVTSKNIDLSVILKKSTKHHLKNILRSENGNLFITIEEDFSSWDNQSQNGSVMKGDIIVVKLDSKLNVIWTKVIEKIQQETGLGIFEITGFYTTIDEKGNILFAFNSNKNNHPGLKTTKKAINGSIACVILNASSGEIISEEIIVNIYPETVSFNDIRYFEGGVFFFCEDNKYFGDGNRESNILMIKK